jgi:pumilio RNA-binding family
VQKLIERVPAEHLSFIPAFKGSVFELSTHPYGCRVLQRCFEHLSEEQTRPLMDELHKYIINLMQDQFGVRRGFMQLSLVTNLPCRTTLYSMFSNMAGSMIERLLYPSFEAKCFICLVTNSLQMSVRRLSSLLTLKVVELSYKK